MIDNDCQDFPTAPDERLTSIEKFRLAWIKDGADMTTVGLRGSIGGNISVTVSLIVLQVKHSVEFRLHAARNTPPRRVTLSPTCITLESSFKMITTLDESSQ